MSPLALALAASVAAAAPSAELAAARALEARGLPLAAAARYRRLVEEDGDDDALAQLLGIADQIGDHGDLPAVLAGVDPARVPDPLRDAVRYHRGVDAIERGALSDAVAELAAIDPAAPAGPRSRLLLGALYAQQGKLKSAVRSFRDAWKTSEDPAVRDRAMLGIARIYYGIERWHDAVRYYALVGRGGAAWPEALFERAWAEFRGNDTAAARGHLLTLRAPSLAYHAWLPEAHLLETYLDLNACAWRQVEARGAWLERHLAPMADTLAAARDRGPDGAWQAWYGDADTHETALPHAFFAATLDRTGLAGAAARLAALDAEERRAARLPEPLRGQALRDLAADRSATLARADRELYDALVGQLERLEDLRDRVAIARFENADMQRAALTDRWETVPAPTVGRLWSAPSVAALEEPFNGEFWADELGDYRVYTPSRCR